MSIPITRLLNDKGTRFYRTVAGGQAYTDPNGNAATAGVLGSSYDTAAGYEVVNVGGYADLWIPLVVVVGGATSVSVKLAMRYTGDASDSGTLISGRDLPLLIYSQLNGPSVGEVTYTGAGTYSDVLLVSNAHLSDELRIYAKTTGGTPSTDLVKIALKGA